jgi:hypothetical protein
VAYVGDIFDVFDCVAVELKHAAQDIFENVCSQIADVRVVINGRPAGIEADFGWVQGLELAHGPCIRVKK